MKTIKDNTINEIIIKNSRFITLIYKLEDNNIDKYLDEAKKLYPKATHYCYAYIYNDVKRFDDDNEPGGTAGMPILNVLEKEQLNNVIAITVRYFGGIKLGAGGLVRAYTKSVTEALKKAIYIELVEGYKIEIEFPYTEEKQINYLLKNSTIIDKEYKETIKYIVLLDKELINEINKYNYKIIEETYIEKHSRECKKLCVKIPLW